MTVLFKHNGVTTESAECAGGLVEHEAHKWRPGEKTEYFTCQGAVKCQFCVNLIWRDKMVQHLQTAHPDKLVPSDGAPATHTGRPAQHSGIPKLRQLTPAERRSAIDPDAWTTAPLPGPDALAEEECDHENGFGPHGCAGCGASASDVINKIEPLGFHAWWSKLVDEAAPTIQRKAGEYGSNSLAEMGRMFARAQGRDRIEDHEALEIGCMIYAKGKLERVLDAMLKGRLPSTDTWHDLGVYSSMAQYIRENKRWP